MEQLKGALYVRMSTEHQKYSTSNQKDAIKTYALAQGIEIVRIYADDGKSGLNIEGRHGLQSLLSDVENGLAEFSELLVLDISRWGRFPDSDESAYYEYLLKRSGVNIHYCAEGFVNDGSIVSTIHKNLKRAMAAEYSKDLSKKVFIGQERLIKLGFRQGGLPGFGLRRMLIDETGNEKGLLIHGQRKSIQTDRVILVPSNPEEITIVNQIYEDFVHHDLNETAIAEKLNLMGIGTDLGSKWNRATIHQILTNEKYIGNNLFNRISYKLKVKRVKNPPELWVRAEGAFEGIVDTELFYKAKQIIIVRSKKFTDAEMLEQLRTLFKKRGYLAGIIIDESENMPSSNAYNHRFGSLIRAYELIGYQPKRDYSYIEINKILRQRHADIIQVVTKEIEQLGAKIYRNKDNDLLLINNEFSVSIAIARHQHTKTGKSRWKIRFDTSLNPDITVGIRMCADNISILDYYLLPHCEFNVSLIHLSQDNGVFLDAYRFDTLNYLYYLSERISILEVA